MTSELKTIPASPGANRYRHVWCIWALGIIVVGMSLFPGDNTFIEDEPRLIRLALDMNAAHQLSPVSLMGSHNLYYGPLAVWLYQFLVLFTSNPIVLTSIHAIFFAAITAISLIWLTRSMNVSPLLAVATMLSPWLWFYFRQLWDNTLCIPLSAMVVASYADFLTTRRPWSLRLAIFSAAWLPLVHFMSLALVVPLAIHLVFFQTRWLVKFRWSVLFILLGVNAMGWEYWKYVFVFHGEVSTQSFMPDSPWRGWVFPLLGAGHLSAVGLDDILGDDWFYRLAKPAPYLLVAATTFSAIIYLASWIGIAMSVKKFWRVIRARSEITNIDQIASFSLLVFLCQTLIDGLQRIYGQEHYFNATWIVYAFFAWLAIDALIRRCKQSSLLARLLVPAYSISLLLVLATAGYMIHRDAGTRSEHYGTDLAEQINAALKLDLSNPRSVRYGFEQWQRHSGTPQSLQVMLKKTGEPAGIQIVQYLNDTPYDARIVVENRTP